MDPILTSMLTVLFGVICGAIVSSYFNLRSARKDILFKRKLEYFERVSQDLEENFRLHKNVIISISNSTKKQKVEQSISELKKNRKSFMIKSSYLYFNINKISEKITAFVNIEKQIFALFDSLINNYNSSSSRKRIIYDLNEGLQKLSSAQESIIEEMKRELYRKKWQS